MDEFYEEPIDTSYEIEDPIDEDEIIYNEGDAYNNEYKYDFVSGKKYKILDKLNKTKLTKEEMDELFNDDLL